MGEDNKLAVNLEQLRTNSTALHTDTHEAMAALEQISSGRIAAGFASLGALFSEVGAAGADMTTAWNAADEALKTRLVGTADRLKDSAELYRTADSGNAESLTADVVAKES